MSNILIIAFSDLKRDPRVMRQIIFLKDTHKVTVCGLTDPQVDGVDFISLILEGPHSFLEKLLVATLFKMKQFEKIYWSRKWVRNALEAVRNRSFHLILANDLDTLPLATKMAEDWKAKVIFDAHEYAPKEYEERWRFRFFFRDYCHYLCSQYLPKVDAMFTVSEGIAKEYSRVYGVHCRVLTNAPFRESQEPGLVSEKQIRLVHHGICHPVRQLENLIHLMEFLDERFTLDLILIVKDWRYFRRLQRLVHQPSRVSFSDPVPMPEISRALRDYDIGIFLSPQSSFNLRFVLPNKLFEFIQGRLCIAIWPSPEMGKVVREYNCGVIAKDFTINSMAEELNRLTAKEIWHFKRKAHEAASVLSAENNREILLNSVRDLVG